MIPAGPANRVRTLESPHQSPRRKLENPRMCPEYLINPRKYKNLKKVTNLILKVKKSQPNLKKAKNQTTRAAGFRTGERKTSLHSKCIYRPRCQGNGG